MSAPPPIRPRKTRTAAVTEAIENWLRSEGAADEEQRYSPGSEARRSLVGTDARARWPTPSPARVARFGLRDSVVYYRDRGVAHHSVDSDRDPEAWLETKIATLQANKVVELDDALRFALALA